VAVASSTTRGRARTLSRETIVGAALDLVRREGPQSLTVRRLGTELGVDATAFYRHFPDKDALVLAVGDHVTRWVHERAQAAAPATAPWQDRIRAIMRTGWEASLEFPGALALTFSRTTGEIEERHMVELLLEIVEPLGLTPTQTVLVYRMFGDATLALTGMNGMVQSLEPAIREKDASAWSRVYAVQPHQEFPATRRHMRELIDVDDAAIYEFTVETLIRGVEALVA
jgi:AcrR family transcriptional regulator